MAISLDFAAAAPFTYNHATGGGAWDDKTIGKNNDVVESLEGGDFACGDIVTFFVEITGAEADNQTIEIDLEFLAASTGQPGVAIGDITQVKINYGNVGGEGAGGTDSGIIDDGGSNATLTSEGIIGTKFDKPATLNGTVRVTDLDVGETLILRIDTKLECDDDPLTSPTGNLQGAIKAGRIVGGDTINVGNQTVPFLNVDDIVEPPPPPDDPRFTLDKQADVSSVDSVGDVITYTYLLDNTGNVDLTGVTLTDDRLGTISGPSSGDDGDGVLETNEVWTYTKTYTVTQNDLDNLDNIVNVATADTDRTDPKTDTVTVDVVRNPALNIEKFVNGQDADSSPGPLLLEGADVKFTYEITNTGNVTLTDFQLTDDKLGTITNITSKGDGDNLFEVGETWKYEATAKAVDGQYTNIGTATAKDPLTGSSITDTDPGNYYGINRNIDVKPGSNPSAFNLSGNGVVPVAILGESDFNVYDINTGTIRLDDQTDTLLSGGGVAPLRTSYSDTNGDGYMDLVMQFSNAALLGVLDKNALNSGANTIYIFAKENDGDTFLGAQQAGDPIKIN